MDDKKGKSNATRVSADASAVSASSGTDNSTPTTAEEAMDNAEAGDGFVDESAYAPTDH